MLLKTKRQFKAIEKILKKYLKEYLKKEYLEEDSDYFFRATLLIFFVSNGIRPAFFFETIDECIKNKACSKELNTYFRKNKINVRVGQWFIYNTNIKNKWFDKKRNEDMSKYYGRLLGYPEILSNKDWKEDKWLYDVNYFINDIMVFGYAQKKSIDLDPGRIKKILKVLKPLGINGATLKIYTPHTIDKITTYLKQSEMYLSYRDYIINPMCAKY